MWTEVAGIYAHVGLYGSNKIIDSSLWIVNRKLICGIYCPLTDTDDKYRDASVWGKNEEARRMLTKETEMWDYNYIKDNYSSNVTQNNTKQDKAPNKVYILTI